MAKDTFYFSHDYNTRNDDKIKRLIRKHGVAGYGIWWIIVEDLYNNANALQTDYDGIAFDLRTDIETVRSIIEDFNLFVIENGFFGSISIGNRIEYRNEKSKKARDNAYKRWNKEEIDANALPPQCDPNAIKESKVNNSIENNNIENESKENAETETELLPSIKDSNLFRTPKIPTFEEVHLAFRQNGGTEEQAKTFYDKNSSVGWFLKGSPITNFRNLIDSFISNWQKFESKANGSQVKNQTIKID